MEMENGKTLTMYIGYIYSLGVSKKKKKHSDSRKFDYALHVTANQTNMHNSNVSLSNIRKHKPV